MTTFFVDNSGLVTTATTVADSIYVQSGALANTTVFGLDGADTINLTEGAAANASSLSINVEMGGGTDSIDIDLLGAFSAGNATLLGQGGADTINLSGSTVGSLKTGDDADKVFVSGASTVETIALGKGADDLYLENATITTLGLGKGHDNVTASTVTLSTASTISLGEGRDTISLTMNTTLSGATIDGDAADGSNYGADSIVIVALQSGSTVKGMGGADTITISGDAGDAFLIAGGDQEDMVTISGYEASSTIGGGKGADTIQVLESIENSAYINGGEGSDSIHLILTIDSGDFAKNEIDGGVGADSITIAAAATTSGAALPTLQYSAFSESNLTTMDVLSIGGINNASGAGGNNLPTITFDYGVDLSAASITEASATVLMGNALFSGNITDGIVTLSGSENVSSVTAVAGTVDTLTLSDGANEVAIFTTNGGDDYLFVQGGVAGTADDSIVSLGDLSGDALAIAAGGSAAVVTFSGG